MSSQNPIYEFIEQLSSDRRRFVMEYLDDLRENARQSIVLRILSGHYLKQIKRLVGHGKWLDWVLDQNTGYNSARTAQRDMALADHLFERLDEIRAGGAEDMTSVSALFELCRPKAQEGALEAALEMIQDGVKMTGTNAAQLNTVFEESPLLGAKVSTGKVALAHAVGLVDAVTSVPDKVRVLAIEYVVRPEVVSPLCQMAANHPEEFQSVVVTGSVYNPVTDLTTPLSEASQSDIIALLEKDTTERIARQQEHIKSWRNGKPPRVLDVTGTPAEIITQLTALAADKSYRVCVYEGEAKTA